LFSLSNSTSKTSQILEESLLIEPSSRADQAAIQPKRNRPRQGGKTKSGGKNVTAREEQMEEEEDSDSGEGEGMEDSLEESLGKGRPMNKKKKISKIPPIRKN